MHLQQEPAQGQVPTTSAGQPTPSQPASDLSKMVKVILRTWFVDPDPEIEAIEVASWLKTLRGIDVKAVHSAWERYQQNGPRSGNGRLHKPTPEDIRSRVIRPPSERPLRTYGAKSSIDAPKAEPRVPVDAETAERICQEAGFTRDHAMLAKRFPSAPTRAAIEDRRSMFAISEQEARAAIDPEQLRQARMQTAIGRAALEDAERQKVNPAETLGRDIVEPPRNNSDLDGEDPLAVPHGSRDTSGDEDQGPAAGPAESGGKAAGQI